MKLIVESGETKGTRYELDGLVLIGRGPMNTIVFDDSAMSLLHGRFQTNADSTVLSDLGSTNGTYVNDRKIVSCELSDGDHVRMGNTYFCVILQEKPLHAPLPTMVQTGVLSVDDMEREDISRQVFGQVTYSLSRKIADGGMGSIYEADQFGAEGFIKKVAIKTIRREYAAKENLIAAFVGEARLVANLVHQNIVQIHHLGRHEGGYFIAMEYINGINLTKFMSMHVKLDLDVPIDLATFIVSRIARGLEYAHRRKSADGNPLNLVHRDVTPNNIMIDAEGEVKLTDFGVAQAKHYMEDAEEDDLVGCVEFMSPEQAACRPVDGRSDIFSLGLVFYELLTGIRVFRCDDGDISRTLEAVMHASIPDPRDYRRDLPDGVCEIVLNMLRCDVEDRYADAGLLSRALEEYMYGGGYGPTVVKLAAYVQSLESRMRDAAKPEYD